MIDEVINLGLFIIFLNILCADLMYNNVPGCKGELVVLKHTHALMFG